MTQVMNESPETRSRFALGGNEAVDSPQIGSPEHAALVDAIKLNFPEIYETAKDAEISADFGEPVAFDSTVPTLQSA
jgi:hypothetical protein